MQTDGPVQVVNVTNAMVKSAACKYFLGESEFLQAARTNLAWSGLVNPHYSGVCLYLSVFVTSNMSDDNLLAKIWFCPTLPDTGKVSTKVTKANLACQNGTDPKGQIVMGEGMNKALQAGTAVSTRIFTARSTDTSEKYGYWIIGPGTCILYSFVSEKSDHSPVVMSFGWWEEPIYRY